MKKKFLFFFIWIIYFSAPALCQHDMGSSNDVKPVMLFDNIGSLNHPVSTNNSGAQRYFNQGLTMIYGFNHFEAIRSFKKAIEFDPNMAMAYWGIAYALGPNYNLDADSISKREAYDAMQNALRLSQYCTPAEADYIKAISTRYSKDPSADQKTLNLEFKNAMKELSQKYPDDLDAATLYAESLMDLKPWQLWNKDGTPAEGTEDIVSTLESVLKRDPNHIGANHYYIHAVEASNDPGRGLNSAKILKTLVPDAGHLVHMPAHIYYRVGDYEDASLANQQAIITDQKYVEQTGVQGIYTLMYYNHNLNFLTASALMEGRFKVSFDAAKQVETNVAPFAKDMQMVEGIMESTLFVLIAFHKWDDIIKYPVPDKDLHIAGIISLYARGIAFASTGNTKDAKKSLEQLKQIMKFIPPDAIAGLNSASDVINIALNMLEGKIKLAEGNVTEAVNLFQKAATGQDALNYDEPPDWYPSVRLTLGGALYSDEKYPEAEKVFRDDLKKNPHNGWALFGLANSLKMQNKNEEASKTMEEFKAAWKNADVILKMEDY